ncbi:response regulator [Christensenellaceae bacterium OttesenSCG-928-L17]|nr:response regulator [Christensenellaceae bacterium OttesenSCG-928-L17]
MPYQVFVAEDEVFVREGIRNCLESVPDFALCGEAEDGEMALSAIMELKPDILITDIKMPFMDGLSLARAVRRAMPWVRILIISGYNEFDFAKQAISIGVAEYLLKPFAGKTLLAALMKLKEEMEAERLQAQHADQSRVRELRERQVLRDAFLDSLLTGAPETGKAMELAAAYEIDLPARKYLTVAIELQYEDAYPHAAEKLRDVMEELLHDRPEILWCLRGSDRMALIVKGDTEVRLDELTYETINIIQGGLLRQLNVKIVSAIGSVAERVGEIALSFQNAGHALHSLSLPAGTVINFGDLKSGPPDTAPLPLGTPMSQRLRHATRQDIKEILSEMRDKFADGNVNSILYSYYWLMDLLVSAARTVSELGGDARSVFSEIDDTGALLRAASSEETLLSLAEDMLERFMDFRENAKGDHYSDVIAQAKQYIYEHYSESDLSLNTVASSCGFSPNHFSSIFSLHTGETFIGFLTRVRIEKARELLLDTDMRSADVAPAVGYQDANYFRYLFKKHMGVSPRDLRAAKEE